MRLLCLTTSYPVAGAPASGVFVASLVKALRNAGQQVTVLTPSPEHGDATEGVECLRYAPRRWQKLAHAPGGIPEQLKTYSSSYFWLLMMLMSMSLAVWRRLKQVDLVLANWSLAGVAAIVGAALSGVPVVTVLRGSDVNRASSGFGRWLLHWCVMGSDALVCVSPSMRDALLKHFPKAEEKAIVIGNGVNFPAVEVARECVSSTCSPRLIFVGNMTLNKGLDTILDALLILRRAGMDFLMDFVGGGDHKALIPAHHLVELKDCISFKGVRAHDAVMELMSSADLFVNASRSEGRSNAILEALAIGVPVVASDIAPNREMLCDGCWGALFPVGDARALADTIQNVLDDRQAAKGRADVARTALSSGRVSWQHCAEQYMKLFARLSKAA